MSKATERTQLLIRLSKELKDEFEKSVKHDERLDIYPTDHGKINAGAVLALEDYIRKHHK